VHIGQKVFALLESSGKSQRKLAEHIEVSQQAINNWKEYGSDPPAKLINPIAQFFDVSTCYLLGATDCKIRLYHTSGISGGKNYIGNRDIAVDDGDSDDSVAREEAEIIGMYKSLGVREKAEFLNVLVRLSDQSKGLQRM
jgi:transcriptional regulator with XRE-family HTH domain